LSACLTRDYNLLRIKGFYAEEICINVAIQQNIEANITTAYVLVLCTHPFKGSNEKQN